MPIFGEPAKTGAQGEGVFAALLNTKNVNEMASEARAMLDSANSGGFRVSGDAAEPIRKVPREIAEDIEKMSARLRRLAQKEPALGDHPYGKQIAEFQRRATAVESDSPAQVLEELRGVLLGADKALEVAVNKYREAEESAASSIKVEQV